jgi:hypothetical protein
MLTAWQVYLPMDRQSISLSDKLPSYLFCSSLVSNIHLIVDCGILSTVQFIVVLEFSPTVLLLEILGGFLYFALQNNNISSMICSLQEEDICIYVGHFFFHFC